MFDDIMQAPYLPLVSLVWLVVMFAPLERVFPAWPRQRALREGFVTDLCFFFGQRVLFEAAALMLLIWLTRPIAEAAALAPTRALFAQWPLLAQAVVILLLGDMVTYWGHRLQHSVGFLWRFHAVHHSSEEIDWLAAHREHPLDGVYTQLMVNLPMLILGFELRAAMGVLAFRSLWAIFIHSNVRLPLGPLHYLVGSPRHHHWHHHCARDAGNYANLAPWLDVVFGTYRCPDEEPDRLGTLDPMPQDYVGLLLHPFRRRHD